MAPLHSSSGSTDARRYLTLAALALVLTIWQHGAWRASSLSLPEYLAYITVTPLESAITAVCTRIHDTSVAALTAPALVAENRRLKQERDELEAERIATVDVRLQLKAMQEKLGFAPDQPFNRIPAQVIGRSSGGSSRWVKIRTGGGKTLEVGNVVREARGLVGRVVEAQGDTGRVVLLVDPQHAVRSRVQRTNDEGMVHASPVVAAGPNRLQLEKVRSGAQVAVGDVVVTSSLGETYPGDIPIGVVESVRRSPASMSSVVAYIKPFVDFERLDYVYVLRAGEK